MSYLHGHYLSDCNNMFCLIVNNRSCQLREGADEKWEVPNGTHRQGLTVRDSRWLHAAIVFVEGK